MWKKIRTLKLPAEGIIQLLVLFKSPAWAAPIYGMITMYDDSMRFSQYDQDTDRFHEWHYPNPEYYLLIPEINDQPELETSLRNLVKANDTGYFIPLALKNAKETLSNIP